MMKDTKPFLVLQLRPETEASDNEFDAIVKKSGLPPSAFDRRRLEQAPLPDDFSLDDYAGIIVGGGPGCVSDPPETKSPLEKRIEETVLSLMPEITAQDFPFLGCCYGIGILAHHLGAPVSKERYGEPVSVTTAQLEEGAAGDPLLAGVPQSFDAFVGHKEAVQALPRDCAHLLSSPDCPFQMIRYGENVYATQFHPEADGDVFELRINIYRDRGYFEPEEAGTLIAAAHKGDPQHAAKILRNFVTRYG